MGIALLYFTVNYVETSEFKMSQHTKIHAAANWLKTAVAYLVVCERIVVSKGTATLITDIWFESSMSALMVSKDPSGKKCLAT
jgi:hypothetical protein